MFGAADEIRNGIALVGIDHVNIVVGNASKLFGRGFGASDIEAPVHLNRIGGNHFQAGEAFTQEAQRAGLAHGGGTEKKKPP
jgi:hypothetical protein